MIVYSLAAPLLKHQMGLEDRISDAYLKCAYVSIIRSRGSLNIFSDRTSRRTLLALDREVDMLETRIRQLEAAMELMKMRKEAAESLRNSLRKREARQGQDRHDVSDGGAPQALLT